VSPVRYKLGFYIPEDGILWTSLILSVFLGGGKKRYLQQSGFKLFASQSKDLRLGHNAVSSKSADVSEEHVSIFRALRPTCFHAGFDSRDEVNVFLRIVF
jgi:hypothetical protein